MTFQNLQSLKKIKYGFNPLINFLCWNKTVSSEHIEINNKTVRYFDKIYYNKLINKTKTFNLIDYVNNLSDLSDNFWDGKLKTDIIHFITMF